jgi:hypothetical protein
MGDKVVRFRFLLGLVVRFTIWGAVLGTLEGLAFSIFYVSAYYGILGIFFHMLIGLVLGIINGLSLGILTFNFSVNPQARFRRALLITSVVLTFVSSILLYSLLYYPLARSLEGNFNLGGTIVFSILPAIIATIIAAYVSQRISLPAKGT